MPDGFILPITLTIAGAAALLAVWLGLRVSLLRRRKDVSIGHGNDPALEARMRAHANFAEYVPLFLILLGLVEAAAGSSLWLWAASILFILARLAHPFGMERPAPNLLRVASIAITWAVLIGLAAYALAIPYLDNKQAPSMSYAAAGRAQASAST